MHIGHYVFYQITNRFKRQFNRIVSRYDDRTKDWSFTHWNHLCVLIFAQLSGCASLRELVDIIQAHAKRSYNLGFGATTPNRSVTPSPILSVITESMKSLPAIWSVRLRREESPGSLNFMEDSMLSTLRPLISVSRSSDGRNSGVRREASGFIHRLILLLRYLSFIESRRQRCMMSTRWTELNMRGLPAMSLTVDTLTCRDSLLLNRLVPFSLSGRGLLFFTSSRCRLP